MAWATLLMRSLRRPPSDVPKECAHCVHLGQKQMSVVGRMPKEWAVRPLGSGRPRVGTLPLTSRGTSDRCSQPGRRAVAGVAKLVDATDLGSVAARRGGSSPLTRTSLADASPLWLRSNLGIT